MCHVSLMHTLSSKVLPEISALKQSALDSLKTASRSGDSSWKVQKNHVHLRLIDFTFVFNCV